jgi:hypothetical protein
VPLCTLGFLWLTRQPAHDPETALSKQANLKAASSRIQTCTIGRELSRTETFGMTSPLDHSRGMPPAGRQCLDELECRHRETGHTWMTLTLLPHRPAGTPEPNVEQVPALRKTFQREHWRITSQKDPNGGERRSRTRNFASKYLAKTKKS